jgi:hypothetical protein
VGTDIHGWIELFTEDWDSEDFAKAWVPTTDLNTLYRARDYTLFAELFGIRAYNERVPVFPLLGFPEDASAAARTAFSSGDHHSATWVICSELAAAPLAIGNREWRAVVTLMEALAAAHTPEDVRLIVWFES